VQNLAVHWISATAVLPAIVVRPAGNSGGAGAAPGAPPWRMLHSASPGDLQPGEPVDTLDDPLTDDTPLSPTEYQRLQKRALAIHASLGEPELLALQEVENLVVLKRLAGRDEILADYAIAWLMARPARPDWPVVQCRAGAPVEL
jgi:hypothetical protein